MDCIQYGSSITNDGWIDIADAPRDGTEVLAYFPQLHIGMRSGQVVVRWTKLPGMVAHFNNGAPMRSDPTFFKHLTFPNADG